MNIFRRKSLFDKIFQLDDKELIFKNCLNINYKNIYDDNYVVQGFCISRDYCLVSAYNKFGAKSRVYLYEKTGVFKKYIDLDNSSHVGGISFDYINNIVYITGYWGKVNAYDYYELISGEVKRYETDINISDVIDGVVSAATLYFYDNRLYVCTFEGIGKMVIFDLEVHKNRIKVTNKELISNLPSAIQGVCVFKKDNNLYYLFSQSFSKLSSCIKLFDSKLSFLGQIKLKEFGIEGIDIDYTGNICSIFEKVLDKTKKVHISELVQRKRNGLENKYYSKGIKFHEKLVNMKEKV